MQLVCNVAHGASSLPVYVLLQVDELDADADAAGNGGGAVLPTPLGRVASFYYLRHSTAGLMAQQFRGQQLDHVQVRPRHCWR
jgi:hypothetical protein